MKKASSQVGSGRFVDGEEGKVRKGASLPPIAQRDSETECQA